MISPDSDLYRAHPDWCLHVPGRDRTRSSRNQLVLDLSRQESAGLPHRRSQRPAIASGAMWTTSSGT